MTHPPLAPSADTVAPDPITRANERFAADPRLHKLNLGIGVYTDETGAVPLLRAVRLAEQRLFDAASPHRYLPIAGLQDFNRAVQALILGADSPAIAEGRAVTVQALGGTGALCLAATLLARGRRDVPVLISDPTWDNHRAIFEAAGFDVATYPYYDDATHAVDCDALTACLSRAAPGTIVVLHACCHNPTGMDLTETQWDRVVDVIARNDLLPVCDLAYQGFGAGSDADRAPIRRLVARGLDVLVANSLSKSLALYGDRVGALTVVASSAAAGATVSATLQRIVRSTYSNPPTHGAAIASLVLATPELRRTWNDELDAMRERIDRMRATLCAALVRIAPSQDLSFIATQRGMFSYTGLAADEVERLDRDDAIHLLATGRMCVAALNDDNVGRVAASFGAVLLRREAAGRRPA